MTAQRATWLGWLAVGTFVLTLIDLLTDPRGAARRRAEAVKAHAALKDDLRAAVADPRPDPDRDRRLSERYFEVSALIPPVPNALFNRLKANHLRKVEISRILSERPGASVRAAKRALNDRLREQATARRPDTGSPGRAP
ncbi:MAG: hypothetical protein WKF54_14165 [Nocardioidaceae bacterium]